MTEASAGDSLGDLMSRISERCYSAGWISGLEFDLWRRVIDPAADPSYGQDKVAPAELAELRDLSEKAGGWVVCRQLVPMATWLRTYSEKKRND